MHITPIKTRIFKENENLTDFIFLNIKQLEENSVLAVTSKIVALSEGRTVATDDEKKIDALIQKESSFALKTKFVWLTIKDGMVQASAGIDKSNGNGKIVLSPTDCFKTAAFLQKKLMKHYSVKNLGILITDSQLLPLRAGVFGAALGYAGFKGLKDYRGKPDLFGRPLKFTCTNVADGLATAAILLMGEGSEQQPLALISDSNVTFTNTVDKDELRIDPKEDIYRPLFEKI